MDVDLGIQSLFIEKKATLVSRPGAVITFKWSYLRSNLPDGFIVKTRAIQEITQPFLWQNIPWKNGIVFREDTTAESFLDIDITVVQDQKWLASIGKKVIELARGAIEAAGPAGVLVSAAASALKIPDEQLLTVGVGSVDSIDPKLITAQGLEFEIPLKVPSTINITLGNNSNIGTPGRTLEKGTENGSITIKLKPTNILKSKFDLIPDFDFLTP